MDTSDTDSSRSLCLANDCFPASPFKLVVVAVSHPAGEQTEPEVSEDPEAC